MSVKETPGTGGPGFAFSFAEATENPKLRRGELNVGGDYAVSAGALGFVERLVGPA